MASIELQGLSKSFSTPSGTVEAVRQLDLRIEAGETVALLGPNGAGKSTTIDMLLGLLAPDTGSVSVLGTPAGEAIAAGRVGAMLQTGALLPDLTVRELLTMVVALYPSSPGVDPVLARADLGELASQRTNGLSGGQVQRVRLAIALAGDPELVVLDEPTVALDVDARRRFWSTMHDVAAGGATVVFATHYLEEAERFADRVVLMARGAVVADGSTTEVKALVGSRTISATLPDANLAALEALTGVTRAERRGEAIALACRDSDAAIRALLQAHPEARDIEIRGAGLEEAFLELTAA